MQHRNHMIWYNPKPIPTRVIDWDWCHKDFDGPGDKREGHAATLEAAKKAIDEAIEQEEQEKQDQETEVIVGRVRASDNWEDNPDLHPSLSRLF